MKVNKISLIILTVIIVTISTVIILTQTNQKQHENAQIMNKLNVKNDLQKHGIEIISATDSEFDAELKQYIGNYNEVIPLVETAKPFALFIRNNSQKEVVGIALRWEFVKLGKEVQKVNQIETSPGVLMGIKPLDPFMIGKTSLINSNSRRFMSYFSDIAQEPLNAFKSNTYKRFVYKLNPEQLQNYTYSVEYRKDIILKDVLGASVILDAVIFNDGTFVGENQSFLFEKMSGMLQARRDFIKKLREARESGKNDTDCLNEFISDSGFTSADARPAGGYPTTGAEVFDYTYKWQMGNYIEEIKRKRPKATDNFILKDFLNVKNSDFVNLKRK